MEKRMKQTMTFILSFIIMLSFTQSLISEEKTTTSGKIINGLRTISLVDAKSGDLTFYRGDYLVITSHVNDTLVLTIDDLKITKKYPVPSSEKPYVKLKKVGLFQYTLGKHQGTVNIIEYAQPQYKAVNAEEAKKIIENLEPLVLDVRSQFEYQRGHLKNSQLIPVQVIQKEYTKLLDYKEKPILIYCASGNRSTVTARILIDNGFKNIYNMRYGIYEWQKNGFEVVK